MLSQKSRFKALILYASIFRAFWKRQNYRDRKQIDGCQAVEAEGGADHNKRMWGGRNLYPTVWWLRGPHTFVKT